MSRTYRSSKSDHIHHIETSNSSRKHRDKGASSSKSSTGAADAPPQPVLSFLFVVNELVTNIAEPADGGTRPVTDEWGNKKPPLTTNGYEDEIVGRVYRYRNGSVSRADHGPWRYRWERNEENVGEIVASKLNNHGDYEEATMENYKTFTIFRGWRFLPVLYNGSDARITNVNAANEATIYVPLRFGTRPGNPGVSEVCNGARPYIAGRGASWTGTLVPPTYENPFREAPQSHGLAGELPVILGLMGLSQAIGRASEAFERHLWEGKRWLGPSWDMGDLRPGPEEDPRGVVVCVCLDGIQNYVGSTAERIWRFEWEKVIVVEE